MGGGFLTDMIHCMPASSLLRIDAHTAAALVNLYALCFSDEHMIQTLT